MAHVVTFATTLATTTGVNVRIEKSWRITSNVNSTPPIGALKIALIPAALPQPVRTGMCCRATRKTDPTPEAMAAPICTMGPSAPAEPPVPIVIAEVTIFSTATRGLTNPLVFTTDSITSMTPCPSPRTPRTARSPPPPAPPAREDYQQRHARAVEELGRHALVKQIADQFDQLVEADGRRRGHHADDHGQDQHEGLVAEPQSPQQPGQAQAGGGGTEPVSHGR